MKKGISDKGYQRIAQMMKKRKPKDDEFKCIVCGDPITHTDDPDEEYCEDCIVTAAEHKRDQMLGK